MSFHEGELQESISEIFKTRLIVIPRLHANYLGGGLAWAVLGVIFGESLGGFFRGILEDEFPFRIEELLYEVVVVVEAQRINLGLLICWRASRQ